MRVGVPREDMWDGRKVRGLKPTFGGCCRPIRRLAGCSTEAAGGLIIFVSWAQQLEVRCLILAYLEVSALRVGVGEEAGFLFAFSEF